MTVGINVMCENKGGGGVSEQLENLDEENLELFCTVFETFSVNFRIYFKISF